MKDEKSVQDLLNEFHELNDRSKVKPVVLKVSKEGHLLLDPTNPHHVAWYENDEDYEIK